jgi:hypothetical protein
MCFCVNCFELRTRNENTNKNNFPFNPIWNVQNKILFIRVLFSVEIHMGQGFFCKAHIAFKIHIYFEKKKTKNHTI